jgi:riboflavin biosynthesis RibT protein
LLTRYKKMFNKIAMGLLSYMPNEKEIQKLQMTINDYETEQDHQLFLWKEEEGIIGLIGILFSDKEKIQIKHISVNPSHRGQGIARRMINSLKELHPGTPVIPDKNTVDFCDRSDINESFSVK